MPAAFFSDIGFLQSRPTSVFRGVDYGRARPRGLDARCFDAIKRWCLGGFGLDTRDRPHRLHFLCELCCIGEPCPVWLGTCPRPTFSLPS